MSNSQEKISELSTLGYMDVKRQALAIPLDNIIEYLLAIRMDKDKRNELISIIKNYYHIMDMRCMASYYKQDQEAGWQLHISINDINMKSELLLKENMTPANEGILLDALHSVTINYKTSFLSIVEKIKGLSKEDMEFFKRKFELVEGMLEM